MLVVKRKKKKYCVCHGYDNNNEGKKNKNKIIMSVAARRCIQTEMSYGLII